MEHNQSYIQEDTIDLRELFAVLKRRKKLIWLVTGLFTLLAVVYLLIATSWWEVNTTLEIGKYKEAKNNTEVYLEKGSSVTERLKVAYIDVFEHVKDRESKIKSISASKKNPQFISITALGKSNDLALAEIQKVINELQNKHRKIIDEIIATKQSELDQIDRNIFQVKEYQMVQINQQIDYFKNVQLPTLDAKIASIEADLNKSIKQKEESMKNLSSLQNNASLAALRLAQIQGLEYKISANKMKQIDLHAQKQQILSVSLPKLNRGLKKLAKIDLVKLREQRKLILLSMQPHNYHNTAIVGSIITQDKPAKPKKALILIVAFITGLMLSIFLAFFLEFLQGVKKEN